MSEQEILQVEEKRRKIKRKEDGREIIDITAIKGTAAAELLQEMAKAEIHEQQRKQTDTRYARRVRVSDHIVQQIMESLTEQLQSLKVGEKPKMWKIVKNVMEALKIISREVGISAAEFAQAIKNVFGPIYPGIDAKSLSKLKSSVKSAFSTCIRHGYEIHSAKIDGVERYFLHRKKEDIDAYRERKEQRIDNEFHSLDEYVERTDTILREQNAREREAAMIGGHGETIVESDSESQAAIESEQTEEISREGKNQDDEEETE